MASITSVPLVFTFALVTLGTAIASEAKPNPARKTYNLSASTQASAPVRVTADLQIGGHLALRDKQAPKMPMSVVAQLRYDQRHVESADAAHHGPRLVSRHFQKAHATIKVGKGGIDRLLDPDRQVLLASPIPGAIVIYHPYQAMTREELDLVDMIADPLTLDALLPKKPLAVGDKFAQDEGAIQALLGLDAVTSVKVESVFVGVEGGYAKIRLTGLVHGLVDGAATKAELRASYLFHLKARRIARFNLALSEKRSIGPVGPGITAVSQLRLSIDAIKNEESPSEAVRESLAKLSREPTTTLVYESPKLGIRLAHDRDWFVTSEEPNRLVLRCVERGDMIAQCNLARLPVGSQKRPATLEQFQKDIRFSLAKRLERLVSSQDWTNPSGLHFYRVVAQGKAEEVPVEWRYYMVVSEDGRRLSLAISVEGDLVERFGDADRQLVDSLQLLDAKTAKASDDKVTK